MRNIEITPRPEARMKARKHTLADLLMLSAMMGVFTSEPRLYPRPLRITDAERTRTERSDECHRAKDEDAKRKRVMRLEKRAYWRSRMIAAGALAA